MNRERMDRVLDAMKNRGLAQLIVSDPLSVYYLTGILNRPFERFWALLLREDGKHVLFSNRLFSIPETELETVTLDDTDIVAEHVRPCLLEGTVGVDKVFPARFLLPIMESAPELKFVLGSDCVDDNRACKDAEERELMRGASEINDKTMTRLMEFFRDGVTETECADFVRACYAEYGCEELAFSPNVSFGANAADPHHSPDETAVKTGDCIVVDIGCKKDGYCSDMTRTFFWKTVSERQAFLYNTVREANELAERMVKPGIVISSLDTAAREHIASVGCGEYFTHRLGHFIGMEDHEKGDVSSTNSSRTREHQVFSIEPGIYIPGEFGCRIEDLVMVTENGAEILNKVSKDITVLGVS